MNTRFSLCIAAELKNLTEIRRFVKETATTLGVDPAVVPGVILAADEAVSNIIAHGYQGQGGTVEIEMSREGDTLVVRLRDEAAPFDPTSVPLPDLTLSLAQRPVGGLGIHLIRQVMDEVSHRITPQGGNELTLVKRGIGRKNGDNRISNSGQSASDGAPAPRRPRRFQLQGFDRQGKRGLQRRRADIILDLSDVPYVSSSGLVALHSIAVMLRGEEPPDPESGWGLFAPWTRTRTLAQKHVKLLNPRPDVDKVLEMAGLSDAWRSTPTWRRPSPHSKIPDAIVIHLSRIQTLQ